MKLSKGSLAIELSKLRSYNNMQKSESERLRYEQYSTDSEIASEILWTADQIGDINRKVIADLGCGTGILGIGALLLGAKKVFFVDIDKLALKIAEENLKSESSMLNKNIFNATNLCLMDAKKFNVQVDTVIMNPPFGTKVRHADMNFLRVACSISKIVYSFHKSETLNYINKFFAERGWQITRKWEFLFPLKSSLKFHKKRIYRVKVCCIRASNIISS